MRRPGQALVEFALAAPLFLLVVLALIDFSRLLFTYISIANGAREMARVAAITRSPSANSLTAFTNYTLIGGAADPATDQVVITVANQSCASDQRRGIVCSPGTQSTTMCSLPLQASCTLPTRTSAAGGYVQVDVIYRFMFNPLFQNALAGVVDAWFGRPFSTLTTSARAYLE